MVASTGKLPAGIYYVSATAYLSVAPGDVTAACWIAKASAPNDQFSLGVGLAGDYTVAETAAMNVSAGGTLQETCDTGGSGSVAVDAGIIAIRVLFLKPQVKKKSRQDGLSWVSFPRAPMVSGWPDWSNRYGSTRRRSRRGRQRASGQSPRSRRS